MTICVSVCVCVFTCSACRPVCVCALSLKEDPTVELLTVKEVGLDRKFTPHVFKVNLHLYECR